MINSTINFEDFLCKNYCLIGRNNTNKSNYLRQISELNNVDNIKSLYIRAEDVIDNSINDSSFGQDIASQEMLYSLFTYNESKENKVQTIFKIIVDTDDFFYRYYTLLETFKDSEGRYLNTYLSSSSYDRRIKKSCSTGINSLLSTIACLLYCKIKNVKTVLIDEIEKHLDSINAYRLAKFIQTNFNELNIVLSTHSEHIIAALDDFTIYNVENREKYLSNDYTDVAIINNKFFKVEDNIFDNALSNSTKEFIAFCINKLETGIELDQRQIEILKGFINESPNKLDSFDLSDINLIFDELGIEL